MLVDLLGLCGNGCLRFFEATRAIAAMGKAIEWGTGKSGLDFQGRTF